MSKLHEASDRAPVPDHAHDPQIDPETGRPVAIVPDGEKVETEPAVPEDEALKVDPDSRIPRPVQPDLA